MTDETNRGANEPVQRTEEDREFAAITDQEIWEEARDRLQIASEAYSENRKRAKAAMLFREGDQWDHDVVTSAAEDSPELTINLTDAFVRRVVNNIKQQRPRGKCHPVGDGADVEMAEIINGIGRHIETRSEASIAYDLAAERATDAGEGYFRLIAEWESPKSFRKDLRILPIRNIFSVHMDTAAIMPSGADQNWCLISVMMPRQEYKRRYPNAANVNWNDLDRQQSRLDWEDKEQVRLAEYFRIREVPDKLYLIKNRQGEETTMYHSDLPRKPGDGRVVIDYAKERLEAHGLYIDGERDSVKRRVEWFRLNGLIVVERQIMPGTMIPVFRVDGNAVDIDGKIRRRGMVESMMDPQRMVNYGEVAKIKRLGLAPKAPWVAAEGQLDGHPEWDDANQKAYSVLTYKPVIIDTGAGPVVLPPPQRQPPAQIEAGFSEFVQGMRSNLTAVAGMPNEPGQDEQGVVVSGRAIERRQWLSDQSHFQYYDHLTQAIAQCWRVMLEWIPAYYSEPGRMQRIIGEDSTPSMVALNQQESGEDGAVQRIKNDMSVGRYDVTMDTGPGYETKREEGAANLIEMVKIPALAEIIAKQAPDLVFRTIDHPYMQELADRLMSANPEGLKKIMEGMSSRAKSVIQALANENQALKQQLQAAGMEIKQGLQKAVIAAQTKIHDTQTRSDTAIKIEEIRAAGKIIDARADRDHSAAQFANQIEHEAQMAMASMRNDNMNAEADRAAAKQAQQQQPTGEQ
ncbi:portal protein [Ralstonia insidiosa]|uniref:portal protein n=1 Tax=Ralstonia insidiosa TaxID=190721 RepID=UPI001427EDB2|nr:portal protein [Ralstonia insidiosa]